MRARRHRVFFGYVPLPSLEGRAARFRPERPAAFYYCSRRHDEWPFAISPAFSYVLDESRPSPVPAGIWKTGLPDPSDPDGLSAYEHGYPSTAQAASAFSGAFG